MANLPETPDYPAGVYQLETSDPVLGGPGGISNRQAEQLGNRTAWLKDKVDAFISGTVAVLKATNLATARTLSISGAGSGSVSFDGSADANIVLTLADSGAVAGTYPKVTINAKGLVNGGAALVAADIPGLDWGKISSGKPSTLAGYGITDALPSSQAAVLAPPGQVAAFAMAAPPAGWLKANGAAISRTTYAALFAAIGTAFGAGDGATTFNLPDLRGEFLRGWDDSRGVDSGRVFGSQQADAIQNITGSFIGSGINNSSTGAFSMVIQDTGDWLPTAGTNRQDTISFDASRVARTAAETRPRNIALLYCIKY